MASGILDDLKCSYAKVRVTILERLTHDDAQTSISLTCPCTPQQSRCKPGCKLTTAEIAGAVAAKYSPDFQIWPGGLGLHGTRKVQYLNRMNVVSTLA